MKVVSVEEMVQIEQAADAAGHSYDEMMEQAGRGVAAALLRAMHPWDNAGSVLVLVGPGNNGGDGLVAARTLRQWQPQHTVTAYLWRRSAERDPILDAARQAKVAIVHAGDDPDFNQLEQLVLEADVIVDALLGTGASRPIVGPLADLLTAVRRGLAARREEAVTAASDFDPAPPSNSHSAAQAVRPAADFDFLSLPPYQEPPSPLLVAVDCPSGLDCNTGALDPASLPSHLTVTFAYPKLGHFLGQGPTACGRLEVADIGVDHDLAGKITLELATPARVQSLLPSRQPDAHKGTFGKALVVAGSISYTGAAHLACTAAYRAGAGLVTLGVIPSIHTILAANTLETTWLLLPEELGVVSPEAVKTLAEHAAGYTALLVGPGLTTEKEAAQFVQRLLGIGDQRRGAVGFVSGEKLASLPASLPTSAAVVETPGVGMGFGAPRRMAKSAASPDALRELPMILDADALNALAQVARWHEHLPPHTILTPHAGEMARLCGCSAAEVQADRVALARAKAAAWQAVVVLKGAYTVVAAPDGRAALLPFANPALSTAGSGDVLAGAMVAGLAQGLAPFEAALVGGYLHGLAGELARQELGEAGVVASDLLVRLPLALRQLRAA